MLKYVLRRLGYGHQMVEVESNSTDIDYPVLHTVLPNYTTLTNVEQMYGFNISKPVHELLPFTATEYVVAGFINIITKKTINIKPSDNNLKEKFISKRLVNIPHHPMGSLEFINSVIVVDRRLHKWLSELLYLLNLSALGKSKNTTKSMKFVVE